MLKYYNDNDRIKSVKFEFEILGKIGAHLCPVPHSGQPTRNKKYFLKILKCIK